MATITVPGVGDTYRTSGVYINVQLGQGPASIGVGQRECLLVMPMLSTGSGTANKRVELRSAADAVSIGGYGSDIHRAARAYFAVPGVPKLWCVPYAETSGGTEVQASVTLTVAGTATSAGSADVWVGDTKLSSAYETGDAAADIAADLRAKITAATHLAATGEGSSASVTPTAKKAGVSGNLSTRVRSETTPGSGITISGDGDLASGSDGTTTELTNLTAALATQATVGTYYVGISYGGAQSDSTAALAVLDTHISVKSAANPGLRSVGVAATRDTLANATTTANARNDGRIILVWNEDGDHDPAELVGRSLAVIASTENQLSSASVANTALNLNPQQDEADRPTADEINTALTEGITPIGTDSTGSRAFADYWVSTASKDPSGTTNDWRAAPIHRRSVADDFVARLSRVCTLNFQGKILKADLLDANGAVNPNQALSSRSVRPSEVRKTAIRLLRLFEQDSKLQQVDEVSIPSLICQQSQVNSNRIELAVDLRVVDHCQQFVGEVNEVSPG